MAGTVPEWAGFLINYLLDFQESIVIIANLSHCQSGESDSQLLRGIIIHKTIETILPDCKNLHYHIHPDLRKRLHVFCQDNTLHRDSEESTTEAIHRNRKSCNKVSPNILYILNLGFVYNYIITRIYWYLHFY